MASEYKHIYKKRGHFLLNIHTEKFKYSALCETEDYLLLVAIWTKRLLLNW